eukprot:CAMPEP_0203852776 /NCGR_PEP_ID=MMETSP0359-20131031/8133_1 /ASSEMBLY_ACC=CAM_ASM_000338 /TAXON_ID=268821 /ORGANISM="Scrippsiella Hangoei, Strain SHTV-5" /LENGTH=691 /DNA_ID=CAMNT_0050768999 /DNA_START=42 /DNA_END=2114 /DNA_ORIENTATION=-
MTAGAAAAAVAAAALAQASIHETTAGDNPAALMHQSPIAELLGAFTSGTLQSEVAVVVCGPQRVRTLFGSAGLPGLLPLLLARCTEVQLDASSPSSSSTSGLFGLSAFYALPEDQGGLLPALDALCGRFEQHDAWETCEVETFTDLHKVFATVVRVLASLGRAGVSSNVRCLGRVPLIFRVCFFSQADGHSGDGTGVACSSLFFVEAPPATAGGPLPAAYRKTSARFGSGNCCVLHAAVGSAPDDVSHIRSSLGPLQALFDHQHAHQRVEPDAMVHRSVGPFSCLSLTILQQQAQRSISELAQLIALRDRNRGSLESGIGGTFGGGPPRDTNLVWRENFGLREISVAEVRRQVPLALQRADRLQRFLRCAGALGWEDEQAFAQLAEYCPEDPAMSAVPLVGPNVELATLAWQRQWQAQELMGRLRASEESSALRAKILVLEQALDEARHYRLDERERYESDEITQLIARLQHSEESSFLSERRVATVESLADRLRVELRDEAARSQALDEELRAAHEKFCQWTSAQQLSGRVKQLEATRQRLLRELRAAHETLEFVTEERDVALRRALDVEKQLEESTATNEPRSRRGGLEAAGAARGGGGGGGGGHGGAGAGTAAELQEQSESWSPLCRGQAVTTPLPPDAARVDSTAGRERFSNSCPPCFGSSPLGLPRPAFRHASTDPSVTLTASFLR